MIYKIFLIFKSNVFLCIVNITLCFFKIGLVMQFDSMQCSVKSELAMQIIYCFDTLGILSSLFICLRVRQWIYFEVFFAVLSVEACRIFECIRKDFVDDNC